MLKALFLFPFQPKGYAARNSWDPRGRAISTIELGDELVFRQTVEMPRLNNAPMRRLLAILLVLLLPMQSSLAAAVAMTGMSNRACDQALTVMAVKHSGHSAAMKHFAAGCIDGGVHGSSHGHSCPHFGSFAMAVSSAALPIDSSASPIPRVEYAPSSSVVLDVPLPPPTRSA